MARPRSLHDIQDSELSTINFMLYGHPGQGKTPFWGTGGERLLLMDSDNGYESAIATGSTAKRVPATMYAEVWEVYEWLKDDVVKGRGPEHMDEFEFNWVVWDSLTLFQDRAMIDDIMADAAAENERQDRYVPDRRNYFQDHNRIGELVRKFVALPINFGISCHVMTGTDPVDGTNIWMPAIQGGGMSSKVCGYMNVVGLLGTREDKKTKRILFQQEGKLWARDRFHALGRHMDNPTLPKVEQAIQAVRNNGAAPAATPIARRRRRRVS